jgi:histone acetyltransferase 1
MDEPEDDRWTVFFLYQKKASASDPSRSSYIFAGYCTAYRFFHFRPPTPPLSPSERNLDDLTLSGNFDLSQLPCRTRISQFIIIPPFQQKGLGPRLYNFIFNQYIKHRATVELTVEDPNEAFDDLRDIVDLYNLRQMPEFQALRINTSVTIPKNGPAPNNIVDKTAWDMARAKAKIAPRQFARVLEMHLMSRLPEPVRPGIAPEDKKAPSRATKEQQHEYRLWRLLAKKRLYKHNKDALGELDIDERITKLEETVSSVEFDYARLLIKAEEQEKNLVLDRPAAAANGKRKAVAGDGEEPVSKKARVEDE